MTNSILALEVFAYGLEEFTESRKMLNTDEKQIKADLCNALSAAKAELEMFKDDAFCDHSVGICYCGFHRTLDMIDEALAKAGEVSR